MSGCRIDFMKGFSIPSRKISPPPLEPIPLVEEAPKTIVPSLAPRETLRFPAEDEGKSLAEMAQRDLDAALQLLAERAQYITGASGSAIALRQGAEMICRASAGPSAPELGAHLQINSGLSGESIRTRQILRCDDAETDDRVNRESCRALGIASVVVMPLVYEQEVNGVFELFSGRPKAFEERDITALQRLAEMIQTAIEHSEATKRTEQELAAQPETAASATEAESAPSVPAAEVLRSAEPNRGLLTFSAEPEAADEPLFAMRGNIGKCQACGFPVSEGRVLCVDCEAHQETDGTASNAPEFLSHLEDDRGWVSSHKYLIGIVVMVIATIVVLLRFR